jgi:hypothetical protein
MEKRRVLLFALALLLPMHALAEAHKVRFVSYGTVLSAACNSSSLTTATFRTEDFSAGTISWRLTDADASVAEVTATCVGTGDGDADSAMLYKVPVLTSGDATGTVNYAQFTYSYPPTIANNVDASQFSLYVAGNRYVKCTFACGNSGSDSIAVVVTAAAP